MITIKRFDGKTLQVDNLNENTIPENYNKNIGNDHLFLVEKETIQDYKVNILRPACEGQFSVMYLLPGIGGNPDEWLWDHFNLRSIVSNLVAEGKIEKYVFVLPQVVLDSNVNDDEKRNCFHHFSDILIGKIMPVMEKKSYILTGPENTMLGGLSYGGKAALYIAYKMKSLFSVVAAFEPSPGLLDVKNDKGEKTVDGLIHDTKNFSFLDYEYVFVGAGNNDDVVGLFPESYSNRLCKNHQPHTFCTLDGKHSSIPITKQFYIFIQKGKII